MSGGAAATRKRSTAKAAAAETPEKNPLVADATAAAARAEKPDGMPAVWPIVGMPRRKRATVFRSIATISEGLQRLSDVAANEDGEIEIDLSKIGVMADFLELAEDIADLLVESAAPGQEDAMRAWAEKADETVLASTFGWYMSTMNPGEAAGS